MTKLQVTGLNRALSRVRALGRDGDEAMLATVEQLTRQTLETAKDNIRPGPPSAPGDFPAEQTGELKISIRAEMPSGSNPIGVVGTAWNLGRWLEVGTGKMRPRPWLLPSFKVATKDASRRLRDEFKRRAK